jgi:hypothetical protein
MAYLRRFHNEIHTNWNYAISLINVCKFMNIWSQTICTSGLKGRQINSSEIMYISPSYGILLKVCVHYLSLTKKRAV